MKYQEMGAVSKALAILMLLSSVSCKLLDPKSSKVNDFKNTQSGDEIIQEFVPLSISGLVDDSTDKNTALRKSIGMCFTQKKADGTMTHLNPFAFSYFRFEQALIASPTLAEEGKTVSSMGENFLESVIALAGAYSLRSVYLMAINAQHGTLYGEPLILRTMRDVAMNGGRDLAADSVAEKLVRNTVAQKVQKIAGTEKYQVKYLDTSNLVVKEFTGLSIDDLSVIAREHVGKDTTSTEEFLIQLEKKPNSFYKTLKEACVPKGLSSKEKMFKGGICVLGGAAIAATGYIGYAKMAKKTPDLNAKFVDENKLPTAVDSFLQNPNAGKLQTLAAQFNRDIGISSEEKWRALREIISALSSEASSAPGAMPCPQ